MAVNSVWHRFLCNNLHYIASGWLERHTSQKRWNLYILDECMYNWILAHFHIQPLLRMSIRCGCTSHNRRTELSYDHREKHHWTGRKQPCSLWTTSHYYLVQSLLNLQLPLSILHERVCIRQRIQSPCPALCSTFCRDHTGTWDLALYRCPQPR